MAGNGNTNIFHVNQIQGLLDQVVRHLKKLEIDDSNADVFSAQTIAKRNALDGIGYYQECDVDALQKAFE